MKYLVDTNFCIVYLRGRNPGALDRMRARSPAEISVCATVRAELVYGALRSNDPAKERIRVDEFLRPLFCYSFDAQVADASAGVRAKLASGGGAIGPYDLQIAATALVHGLILVTHNVREFGRVPGLVVEDWEVPATPDKP